MFKKIDHKDYFCNSLTASERASGFTPLSHKDTKISKL